MEMTELVRKGECNRCGECCKPRFYVSEEAKEFYRKNGLPDNGQCQFLALIDGVWTYTIHHERPDHCRRFPLHPDQLEGLDNCSYYFVEKE